MLTMNQPNALWVAVFVCGLALAGPTDVRAQGPSQSGQSQHTQATQLPLSGRGGQSGSVTAVEAPIAGTTNSVTTINPSVQVQGPYAGSFAGGGQSSAG